jgi:hypothetical protein
MAAGSVTAGRRHRTITAAPEPDTLLLLAISQGLFAIGWLVWRFLTKSSAFALTSP